MPISDKTMREFELLQVRKMTREIKKRGDAGVSHFMEAGFRKKDDLQIELLEDVLDFEAEAGRLYYT